MYQVALSTALTGSDDLDRVVVLKGCVPLFFRIETDSEPWLLILTQDRVVVGACLGSEWVRRIDRVVNRFWNLITGRWRSFINKFVL